VSASYTTWSTGVARYEAKVNLHGEEESVSGAGVDAWATFLTPVPSLLVSAGAVGLGDGDGRSGATLTIERAFVPGLLAAGSVAIIELGANIAELIAMPAKTFTVTWGDKLPPLVPTEDGRLVREFPGGATFEVVMGDGARRTSG
jgi:hypothetical protein